MDIATKHLTAVVNDKDALDTTMTVEFSNLPWDDDWLGGIAEGNEDRGLGLESRFSKFTQ